MILEPYACEVEIDGERLGLPTARLAELNEPSRLVGGLHLALEWGLIVGAVLLAEEIAHPVATALALIWIAARQHALLALTHEAAHGRLLRPLLGRRAADLLAEALSAWPVLASMRSYRRVHMAHHRHLGTHEDPDWARNRPDRWGEVGPLHGRVRHLLGLHQGQRSLLEMFFRGSAGSAADRRWARVRLVYYGALGLGVTWLHAWPIVGLYWFLPLFLWTTVLMRLRGISEHWAVTGPWETRTLLLSGMGRLLFLPKSMGYHLEHHLYPGVPFHRLPKLHAELMALPDHAAKAHVTRGVPALVKELISFRRDPPREGAG